MAIDTYPQTPETIARAKAVQLAERAEVLAMFRGTDRSTFTRLRKAFIKDDRAIVDYLRHEAQGTRAS